MAYEILHKVGYYTLKKKYKDYILRKRLCKEDDARKKKVMSEINAITSPLLQKMNDSTDIIISLTSYGARVKDTLPYTLYSLLSQTFKPNRIIVWLDNVNWNEGNLPESLEKLRQAGVEYMFTEDIRSYKKLVPTLIEFPKNLIITVDDDLYYNPYLVEWLLDKYNHSDKRTVIGTLATMTTFVNDEYLPYSQWDSSCKGEGELCLIGCGGILYPPCVFDGEIIKKDLFTKLAPTADDLWFWAMEKRIGLHTALTEHYGYGLHVAINRLCVFFPTENPDNLYYINELVENRNDIQLQNLIKYYNLHPSK